MKYKIAKDILEENTRINKKIERFKEVGLYDEIINFIPDESFKVSLYCWFHKISKPVCKKCGKPTKFKDMVNGFSDYCSYNCSASDKSLNDIRRKKREETNLKKFGTISPLSNENIKDKIKQTCLERYGVEHISQTDEFKEKVKQTCLEKYGVTNISKSDLFKDIKKETSLKKYGVEHISQTDEFKEKVKQTCLEKYGSHHSLQSKEVRDKIKQTCLERYGVDHYSKTPYFKESFENTCLERYGVTNPSINIETKQKREKTFLKLYNKKSFFETDEFREKVRNKKREKSFEYFLKLLSAKDFVLLSNKEDVIRNKEFTIRCNLCQKEHIVNTLSLQRITCICRQNISLLEREISRWLKSFSIAIIENDRSQITPLELDIYIPEHKLAIEFDGLFWHCEINKEKNYHLNKTLECQEKGIQLIHVFENEWLYKQEIVKSIIKAKLGIFDERIFARKCIVKELSQQDYNEFLELNHLQGKSIAKTRIGLFYNDELVSAMGFGKNRFKKDETELIRFANKLNTSVVGGFSKLLKYFIINFKPDNLVSYCDLRYFDGSGYLKNGFRIIEKTDLNYYYFKNPNLFLFNRVHFQKHKLKDKLEIYDEALTEHENMLNNGYYRIYDCGNLKLEYNLS